MTETKNPFLKRPLNAEKRLMLMNLACRKFFDQAKRDAEVTAEGAFAASFANDAKALAADELAVLRKYGKTARTAQVELPSRLRLQVGVKEIVVSEEKTVDRAEFEEFYCHAAAHTDGFASWRGDSYNNGVSGGISSLTASRHDRRVTLPEMVEIPGSVSTLYNTPETYFDWDQTVAIWGAFISDTTKERLADLFRAMRARARADQELLTAMFNFLTGAKIYGDVLNFWPEAAEIELELFGERPLVNGALLVLKPADMALLCNNMGRRGVESGACMAALSPAYAEAAA